MTGTRSIRLSPGVVVLTGRESEILALIAQGHTNQEIGERLFLSINSIKTYIRSAYRKMGVERRTQAVIWYLDDERRRARDTQETQKTETATQSRPGALGESPGAARP